jgi:hypothetical protein
VSKGEVAVQAWDRGAARRNSMWEEIWCKDARGSLATCSRWSTQVTGRVDARGSGVRR